MGGILATNGGYTEELRVREQKVAAAFYSMGQFWYLKNVPWRFKRAVFICKVQNSALCNIEAFLPSAAQYQRLDSVVAQYARRVLMGKAGNSLAHENSDSPTRRYAIFQRGTA